MQTMSTLPLGERILDAYDDLTKSERRLADVLLKNQDALVLYSASELSERARTSKATTARFFQRMGFPSFKTAQKDARSTVPVVPSEADRFTRSSLGKADLSEHLATDMQNLVRSVEQLRSDELSQAVQLMARAEKLWIVGFGDNYALAHFARALLIRVKPDIRMIPIGGFSVPEEFASIARTDAMLALGVGRRTRSLRSIMRSGVNAGAQVVLVTDQNVRAGNEVASVTLRCRTKGTGVFDSVVAPVSLITFLCNALALRIGQSAIERLQFIDSIHEEWGDVLSGDL
ncbi:DNA-binding MurR/RpiR family transcriptional regulator [Pararhizobium capsulatum DSM 1112]|uniref:DNA-binding MurR/RpiR family transcriptional regulator n=1 Tax=Pararhizobium capsulatum DSM 1112 TaxID=1121113 RepID=A0ABU0BYA4_9HYPH|nr:MurR/RpiR family transcriptional regulator [Pararhizobium capsulatum]MDQ0323250.1 DNA-binding MurR/RpiR family transcriptional regulator [Pararhizobium capsulatum DSM 1112]